MTASPPRTTHVRKSDALATLASPALDAWVATASVDGSPYLVPLSLAWDGQRVILAVAADSPTARNLAVGAAARVGVGPTRDVVMIDAAVERVAPVGDDDELHAAYVAQADWDPRESVGYMFVVLRLSRIQAWREADEIAGRTLMRDGDWLV